MGDLPKVLLCLDHVKTTQEIEGDTELHIHCTSVNFLVLILHHSCIRRHH